jgi:hypothetical protein
MDNYIKNYTIRNGVNPNAEALADRKLTWRNYTLYSRGNSKRANGEYLKKSA